jgi:hypothetical protein
MAGTRQYNNLLALFENWDMYTNTIKTSAAATGFLQQQQDEYMESIEAHLEQLATSGERVYDALFDTDSMNKLIDGLSTVVDFLANAIEAIGGGGNLLKALIPSLLLIFSGPIASGLSTFVINL